MKKKILKIFIILLLLSIFIFINIKNYVSAVSYELKENVFRLHIIANSNSSEDQDLKLKIRDKIITYMNKIDTTSKTEVIEKINSNIKEIIYNIFFRFNISIILNLNLYSEDEFVIIENSSFFKLFFKFFWVSSSITPLEISVKHKGGKRLHHQFSPSAFPIFTFIASYIPAGKEIFP